jgi:hypothetical protein
MLHNADGRGTLEETPHQVSVRSLADDDQGIVALIGLADDLRSRMPDPHPGAHIWKLGLYDLTGSGEDRVDRDRGPICPRPDYGQDGQRFSPLLRDLSTEAQSCLGMQ